MTLTSTTENPLNEAAKLAADTLLAEAEAEKALMAKRQQLADAEAWLEAIKRGRDSEEYQKAMEQAGYFDNRIFDDGIPLMKGHDFPEKFKNSDRCVKSPPRDAKGNYRSMTDAELQKEEDFIHEYFPAVKILRVKTAEGHETIALAGITKEEANLICAKAREKEAFEKALGYDQEKAPTEIETLLAAVDAMPDTVSKGNDTPAMTVAYRNTAVPKTTLGKTA